MEQWAKELRKKKGVVIVGKGTKRVKGENTGRPCITVAVKKKSSNLRILSKNRVPKTINGMETDVIVASKPIVALNQMPVNEKARTDKWRPAPGGVSIGHKDITAGSIGWVALVNGVKLVVSNCHVLANSNAAKKGDICYQPGPADRKGTQDEEHGYTESFIPMEFWELDLSDCPIAGRIVKIFNSLAWFFRKKTRLPPPIVPQQENPENFVDLAFELPISSDYITEEILGIGVPTGYEDAEVGEELVGSGRTSGITEAEVIMTDGVVNVSYGGINIATLVDQLITTPTAEGGDSGSAYVKKSNGKIAGLRFAGSSEYTIANKISNVVRLGGIDE